MLEFVITLNDNLPSPWKGLANALFVTGLISFFLWLIIALVFRAPPGNEPTTSAALDSTSSIQSSEIVTVRISSDIDVKFRDTVGTFGGPENKAISYRLLSIYHGVSWHLGSSDSFVDFNKQIVGFQKFDDLILSKPEMVNRLDAVDTLVGIGLSSGAPKDWPPSKHQALANKRASNLSEIILRRSTASNKAVGKSIYSCSIGYNQKFKGSNNDEERDQRSILILGIVGSHDGELIKELLATELPKLAKYLKVKPMEYSLFPHQISCKVS